MLAILLLQVRNAVSNRTLLISAAAVELASILLIPLLNYVLGPIVLAMDTPLSFTVSFLPSIAISSFFVLLLGVLFLVEQRRNRNQDLTLF